MKYFLSFLFLFLVVFSWGQSEDNITPIVQNGHSQYIRCADFSTDGRYIITGSGDNTIILWEVKSGKQIRNYTHHTKAVKSVCFNHQNNLLLSTSKDNTIKIVEVLTGKLLLDISLNNQVFSNAYFSQDDSKIVAITTRDNYFVFDVKTQKLLGEFKKDFGAYYEPKLINSNGTKVLSKDNYKSVSCLDLKTKDTLFTMPFDKAYTMHFSHDDKYIVIGSAKLFSKVFNAQTGEELFTLSGDNPNGCDGCNTNLSISPQGKFVFTMSSKSDGILWGLSTGKKIANLSNIKKRPNNIIFSSDEKYLVLNFGKELQAFDLKSKQKIIDIKNDWLDYYQLKFNPVSAQIILPEINNTAIIWDIEKRKKVASFNGYQNQTRGDGLNYSYLNYYDQGILNYMAKKSNLSISPNDQSFIIGKVDSSAILVDFFTGRIKKRFVNPKTSIAHTSSKNGKWLAIAGGDGIIRVYNTENNTLAYQLKGHGAVVFDLRFSDDSETLISGGWDANLLVWDFKNETIVKRIDMGGVSPFVVRFSPKDLYFVTGNVFDEITFWEVDSREKFRTLVGHTQTISDIDFSEDGKKMVSASWDGNLKIWDVLTGMLTAKVSFKNNPIYAVKWHNGKIFTGGASKEILVYDEDGQLIKKLDGHTASVTSIQFTTNQNYMISRASNGEVIVWNNITQKPIYTYIQINNQDWLATTPKGYFDGSPKGIKWVNYVTGNEVISINSLFKKYYTPNLIQRVMNGEKLEDTGANFKEMIKNKPKLALSLPQSKSGNFVNQDSIYNSKLKKYNLNVVLVENTKNIDQIKIYNNGKLLDNESYKTEIEFRGGKNIKPFEVELISGINHITAVAVNAENIESDPVSIRVKYNDKSSNTDLYIFSVGINDYKNKNYQLNYAVNDAKDFTKSINKSALNLFDNVFVTELYNDKATKQGISNQFKTLLGQIQTEDVLVFYFAGHGTMDQSQNPDFYLVAHALTNLYGTKAELEKEGVSATELMQFSTQIKAQKQLFILDACHSGGAINTITSRGANREKTIAQLARNTGTFFLTASQDVQYANESGDLKHGLFTYALLEVLSGKDQNASNDGKITINEIKSYVDERVPELSNQYHGSEQYPTSYSFGQDFPIVILK
ncbi:MAG: caspase family protein [Putridiphycobacter sp.]